MSDITYNTLLRQEKETVIINKANAIFAGAYEIIDSIEKRLTTKAKIKKIHCDSGVAKQRFG